MKTKLITLALAILVVFGVTGCAKKEASIYGKWQAVTEEEGFPLTIIFEFTETQMISSTSIPGFEDYSQTFDVSYSNDGDTWTITRKDDPSEPLVITISDDTFTLSDDGISVTFHRV